MDWWQVKVNRLFTGNCMYQRRIIQQLCLRLKMYRIIWYYKELDVTNLSSEQGCSVTSVWPLTDSSPNSAFLLFGKRSALKYMMTVRNPWLKLRSQTPTHPERTKSSKNPKLWRTAFFVLSIEKAMCHCGHRLSWTWFGLVNQPTETPSTGCWHGRTALVS